jgi:hypothetical protein
MNASTAASSATGPTLTPVAKTADPLFLATSVEWLMDSSIPIEIRMLCQLIFAQALTEAKVAGRDFTDFGRDNATAKINVAWIIEKTGWPKNKAESIRAEALEKGYLTASGSARTGYLYTVTLSLRTYRGNDEVPASRSLFASDHTAPKPKPSTQLPLGELGSAAIPPPDMRRWSRADRDFYSRSSGAIRAVYSRLSGAERKLFSRLSGANQELYSRSSGADHALLLRLSGANDELYSRRSGAKKGLSNVRARSQEPVKNHYHKLLAEIATPELRNTLLLLARKREEDTDEDSKTFVNALGRIVDTLDVLCDGDRDAIRSNLARVCADERVTAHENPIAMMVRGICNKPRFLLTTKYQSRIGRTPDERDYYLLPEPLQHSLRERVRIGRASPDWCHERNVSDGARRVAEAIVHREDANLPDPPATPVQLTSLEDRLSSPAPAIVITPIDDMPDWWQNATEELRSRVSPATFNSFVLALRATDIDGVRTVIAPVSFTLQKLRKDLNADLDSVLADLGYDVVVQLAE